MAVSTRTCLKRRAGRAICPSQGQFSRQNAVICAFCAMTGRAPCSTSTACVYTAATSNFTIALSLSLSLQPHTGGVFYLAYCLLYALNTELTTVRSANPITNANATNTMTPYSKLCLTELQATMIHVQFTWARRKMYAPVYSRHVVSRAGLEKT